ncbi:MAG: hypothetical protein HYY18_17370 [Planctomycetes bacterium]|nr:hypothetical protein [Planctomycetota bacterium]
MDIANLAVAFDAARFGGKAARLAGLMRAGFRVPDGVCVPVEACAGLLAGDEVVGEQIVAAAGRLAGPFAVRSSGVNEDSGAASFAGQFETVLNVLPAELVACVRRCAASGRGERVGAYAKSRRVEAGGAAVLVQQMVEPEWAGVLFTANPVTQNLREMVVNAAEGLGDAVVGGTVKPRTVRMDREGRARDGERLDEPLLRELARAGRDIERFLGEPADVEWAWRRGELHILQARPITNLVRYPPRPHEYSNVYVWTHVNFAETMPKATSPLGWSLMEYAAARTFGHGLRLRNAPGFRPFEFLFGRVYWNLTLCFGSPLVERLLSDSLESLSPPVRAEFDRLVRERRVRPRAIFTGAQKVVLGLQCALLVPAMLLRMAWAFVRRPGMEGLEARIRGRDGAEARDARELAAAMERILREGGDEMRREYLPSFLLAVIFFTLYIRLAPRLLGAGAAEALDLVAGEPDWTTRADLSLWELAELRRRAPEKFEEAFARHLEQFGHRGPNEQDAFYPRMADAPELARALLENCARAGSPAHERRRAERETRARERMAAVPWPRRLLLEPLRRLTARWLPHRENGKHFLMLAFHRVRRLALRLGDRLAAEGALRAADDVFFLTIGEIAEFGRGKALPVERIGPRKADFRRYATVRAPMLVTSDGWAMTGPPPAPGAGVLRGDGASAGVATGKVRVILDPHAGARIEPGEILVAPHTDPGWTPLFLTAAAVVTEVGGIISHGAVVARELGLPAVVNVHDATRLLKDGDTICVDGSRGVVTILQRPPEG